MVTSIVLAAAATIAWILAGRQVTLLLDRLSTGPEESLPASPVSYSPGFLRVGERSLELDQAVAARVSDGKLWVEAGGRAIALGAAVTENQIDYEVTPEPGTAVSLHAASSRLGWPVLFQLNLMSGISPSWKRFRHYRMTWRRQGEEIQLRWRYEQWHYKGSGWGGDMMSADTGLLGATLNR